MFDNIHQYHNYIETSTGIQKDDTISLSLQQLREKISVAEEKKLCSYEIFINDFNVSKNLLRPRSSYQNESGRHEYPNLQLFDDNLDYLKLRAASVEHPKLKAKYNHILWLSDAKHITFAKTAIDSYYNFLTTCIFPLHDVLASADYIKLFENLFSLSQEISYRKDEVLGYLVSILGTGRIHGYQEYQIMGFIVDVGKKITNTLGAFYNYVNKVIDGNLFPNALEDYLKLQLIIAQKINKPLLPLHNKLAEFYISKSKPHEGTFVVQDYYMSALQQYQKAGNKEKMEEVCVIMEKAKDSLNLTSVPFEFSDSVFDEFFKNIENQIDHLLASYGSDMVFEYLIKCPDIFPKADQLNNSITNSIMDVVSVTTFDHNRNISGKSDAGFNMYDIYIKSISIKHLAIFFQKAHSSGKLSFNTITDFILKHTWYGNNVQHIKSNQKIVEFKWAQQILPALESFFNQTEIDSSLNKYNHQAYMLCIDSLSLKFEGLLREFSRKIGAQTIEIKENAASERIALEKLLDNQKIINLIPADDIALFKYLFTNQGANLRNNVAHSFFLPTDYTPQWMWLLITATLKLGFIPLSLNQNN